MIAYKRTRLGSPPAGTFRRRGQDRTYEHILPTEQRLLNFLAESRDEILSFLAANPQVTLHRYLHHLNSSQAFALNLFVPFFEGGPKASGALLAALGPTTELLSWEPEAIHDHVEGTNLDAVWDTRDGARMFCEVKLSEREFGTALNDERHLLKLQHVYLPRLAPYLSPALLEPSAFFRSYQILRNIWHMVGVPNGRLLFLLPRANTQLWPMLDTALCGVKEQVRERIRCVAIEDVLDGLVANEANPTIFRKYADQLREKYVPSTPVA